MFMKAGIHPTYNSDAKIICSCGAKFVTGSVMKEIHIELCAKCHPHYTGEQKLVDTGGRVNKFKAKQEKAAQAKVK